MHKQTTMVIVQTAFSFGLKSFRLSEEGIILDFRSAKKAREFVDTIQDKAVGGLSVVGNTVYVTK